MISTWRSSFSSPWGAGGVAGHSHDSILKPRRSAGAISSGLAMKDSTAVATQVS